MSLILYNGKLLRTLNGLAGSLDCCCPCCDLSELPGTEFEFEGQSFVVELDGNGDYAEEYLDEIESWTAIYPIDPPDDITIEFEYNESNSDSPCFGTVTPITKKARVSCGPDGVWRVTLTSVCREYEDDEEPCGAEIEKTRTREWTAEFECDQETGAPKGDLINVTLVSDTGDPPDCIPAQPDIRVVSLP